jgi:hypothetical protein
MPRARGCRRCLANSSGDARVRVEKISPLRSAPRALSNISRKNAARHAWQNPARSRRLSEGQRLDGPRRPDDQTRAGRTFDIPNPERFVHRRSSIVHHRSSIVLIDHGRSTLVPRRLPVAPVTAYPSRPSPLTRRTRHRSPSSTIDQRPFDLLAAKQPFDVKFPHTRTS